MRLILRQSLFTILTCLLFTGAVLADTEKSAIEVAVTGVNDTIKKSIIDGLTIQRQRDSQRLSERMVNRLHQSAQAEIRQTLTVYGYYNPQITADLQQTAANQWLANYQIDTGELVRAPVSVP